MTADEEEEDASTKKEETTSGEEDKKGETPEQDVKDDKRDEEQEKKESESSVTQGENVVSEEKDKDETNDDGENEVSQKTDDSSKEESQEKANLEEEPETTEEPEPEPEVEPEPEPEPIKISRNVNIDGAVDTLTTMEDKVTDLLADMKVLMDYYHENLTSKHLSEFVDDLDKFRGDFQSLRDAYQKCESLFTYFNKSLKDLRGSGEQLNSLMDKKFREEDLEMWIESEEAYHDDKSKLKEERVAIEKSALAKATEAKAAVARASVAISESSLYAAEAEAAAGEAVGTAKRAWECAEVAKLEAEEARKAAIEKKKVEEEARKRAEERARKKAEEERLKQEEEDKKLKETADAKGTSFEDEKRKAMAEKAKKEAERKNPKNWPRYVYSVEPGDYDPGVGCVIRAIDGSMTRDDVDVTKVSQLTGVLKLVENEELISNIIEIKAKDPDKKLTFDEPMSIAIPHCLQRAIIGREPIIKQLQPTGRWTELPTSDVVFDDIRELRFVEIRSRRFGIFAVVLRLKKDVLTLHKKGNKVNSTVDARVSFTCKPGTFKNNVNFSCEVQAVDSGLVNDLSTSRADCSSLHASSPIVRTHIPNRKLSKTLVIAFPLPTAQHKLKRPQTAPVKKESESRDKDTRPVSERPLTSFSTREEKPEEEELHLLCRDDKGTWTVLPKVTVFQPKNKDIVLFEIDEPRDRLVVLKTKEGISPIAIERIAAAIENAVLHRSVRLILRQKSHDPSEVNVSCVPSFKVDKSLKRLADEGYDDGPAPSKEIIIKEGQILEIQFRGNVRCISDTKTPNVVFNTYIRSRVKFSVEEIDKFAQKSFDFYRGFAQVFTNLEVPVTGQPKTTASGQKPVIEMTNEFTLLSDLLISIPKPEPEPPKPLNTAPVKINGDGPRKEDVFEYVASELGEEWKKLAQYLCLKTVRIQAILRQNNQNSDPKRVKYDMLVTWAKRIPRSVNKLEMLAQALMACGRGDVALELRERDQEYRRQRALQFREVYLRRAFVKVAQNPDAVNEWKSLATNLGVPETEVIEIDRSKPSVQEKCFHSLQRWQDTSGESATLPILAEQLKTSKYKQLARDIEAIGLC
ncbi:hypothetical protein FSP39_021461 [Pinctada imbricata]|uniref:Death domain-containing protein n=1 Tax=Pinctada imbricata TaxID=66713 RepID=A0AA89C2D9_PINIB|nr:hypothetical protein FSP39_021461 [Pinctada imbricata]